MILVHDEESDDDPDLNDGVDYNEYEVSYTLSAVQCPHAVPFSNPGGISLRFKCVVCG